MRFPIYAPLLVLAVAYTPGVLLLSALFGRLGGFSASFRRDYSPLLTCGAMALAAACLPLILAAWTAFNSSTNCAVLRATTMNRQFLFS